MHDLVIRNARLCDGNGAAIVDGDLAIKDGRIAALGRGLGRGRDEVDARGFVLAPGIVDPHTHFDAQITWDPAASPSVAHGVTTLIMGNCGFTIAPCRARDRERTLRNLTQVEGMALEALQSGTRWEFETFPEYLAFLERRGVVPNVAVYCGHSAIRTWVMGEDANRHAATDAEIDAMRELVRGSLSAGAIGFSTSTFEGHNGFGGVPMPSRLADDREVLAILRVLREMGRGHSMLTRSQSNTIAKFDGWARESGRPVFVAPLMHDPVKPELVFDEMEEIAEAHRHGRRIYAMVHSAAFFEDFTLRSAYTFEMLDAWHPAIALYADKPALERLYRDPSFRASVRTALDDDSANRMYSIKWDKVEIVATARPENHHLQGKTVAELAMKDGKDPLDWFLDFGLSEELGTEFSVQILNGDEESVRRLLKDPFSTVALSDAGAHLTLFCYAGYALQMLGRWVRERGDFTLEEAVKKLTSTPADLFGIRDRGRLAPGLWADLLLFDPATVGVGPKRRVRDLPGGAVRLTTDPLGVHGIWINGVRVADERGILDGAGKPGHVLREFAA
jgi:N-acyl-D-aspartate/D-glutamate deacylase